ncbi:MAG: dihydropteroate synthase [Gammaproteobacteria bacterium]|nr:dihydropteroate synthase [Gammaproteobacteria bacterium]
MITSLDCAGKSLDLTRTQVMGILNVTPDSFSDGGLFVSVPEALKQARQMLHEGATLIDVGGESTRPGATDVSVQEELDRVIPVIEAINKELDVIVSIDSSKPEVMKQAASAGAGLINDVRALREPGALQAAKKADVPVCLMHMLGEPRSMQEDPQYDDVVKTVKMFLQERIQCCEEAGISAEKILIDPGFGFGKTADHNLSLIKRLAEFLELGKPVLMGVSRKSTIGTLTGKPVGQRLPGSIALTALCCQSGARIIRTHDVAATVDAITLTTAVMDAS